MLRVAVGNKILGLRAGGKGLLLLLLLLHCILLLDSDGLSKLAIMFLGEGQMLLALGQIESTCQLSGQVVWVIVVVRVALLLKMRLALHLDLIGALNFRGI